MAVPLYGRSKHCLDQGTWGALVHYLYCSFLAKHKEWAVSLYKYAGFTDVEFNPHRSINCQARSAALFLSLMKRGHLDGAMKSPGSFIDTLTMSAYRPQLRAEHAPQAEHLFAHH